MPKPFTIHLTRVLPTHDLWAAWRIFSDTDRFNREAGLGFYFRQEIDEQGRPRRYGEVRRMGIRLRWEDEPFQLEAPRTFRSVRRFQGGPLDHLVATIVLDPREDGVHLDYRVDLYPVHPLLLPAIWFEATTSVRPMLNRTIDATAKRLSQDQQPAPRPATLARFEGVPLGEKLAALVDHGDPREVDRMRPLALARAWQVPEAEVLDAFLGACAKGALQLRYDLLCPSCHGPKVRLEALDLSEVEPHCESCRIRYDGTLPDSLEISFKPAEDLRQIEVPLDCINSPVHTPQVLARVLLPAGEEVRLTLNLESGAYLLRTFDGSARASLEVREGLRARAAAAELRDNKLSPALLRVGPGQVDVHLHNRSQEASFVQLERRYRPEDALPLSRLLEHPRARELVDTTALPSPPELRHLEGAILLIDGADEAEVLLHGLTHDSDATFDLERGDQGPIWSFASDGCVLTLWRDLPTAMLAAWRLLPAPELSMLLDHAQVAVFRTAERELPLGPDVERSMALVRRVGAGRVAIAKAAAEDPDLSALRVSKDLPLIVAEGQPFHWISLPAMPRDTPPTQVGPYRISGELARGGMGVVYSATDPQSGEELAVKMLLPEIAADPSNVQRFYFEARIASRIEHPNTIRVFDYGAADQDAWMVMERLYGEELADRIQGVRKMPLQDVVKVALAVLDGLDAAHEHGVVHRDIKPANIFLCEQPEAELPKVLDFGVAIRVEDTLDPRAPILGTPRYLAPEQVERAPLDGRVDLYALGLVLYELLTGDIPFSGQSVQQLAMIRLVHDPEPLSTRAPDVPAPIADVVMKALEVEPDDRWSTAREMAGALRRAALESGVFESP
ncbi:MAG: serine/threonine protein kinase [Deltaproteobacteria bacterium]|nr:MAG: serine/threonine protein kinase [Deltaproteobacteria bacterium]